MGPTWSVATRTVSRAPGRARTATDLDTSDGLLVYFDTYDDPPAWLRAGEGLGAMWLAATTAGLALVPLSQVIEAPETRAAFQTEVLGSLARPLLLVRVGWRSTALPPPARTPRRPVSGRLRWIDPGRRARDSLPSVPSVPSGMLSP